MSLNVKKEIVMNNRLKGKVAVITGAGSGMGREIATLFAAEGASVAVLDVNANGATETVKLITDAGGTAKEFVADISDVNSVEKTVKAITQEFGKVTTLVNNAGVFDNHSALLDTSEALWDRIIAVNLKGIFLLSKALFPLMQATGNAAVVNIASVAGVVGRAGGFAYTASKHGVIGMTKSMAADYGPVVRCNAVLPGAVLTSMTQQMFEDNESNIETLKAIKNAPAGRYATPDEIAKAALFLASDDSSFVYGAQLAVDGGWTAI